MRSPHPPHRRSARRRDRIRLMVEQLESRALPALSWLGLADTVVEAERNDTLDLSHHLGAFGPGAVVRVVGAVGDADGGRPTDVDFYAFHLDGPTAVRAAAYDPDTEAAFGGVLSLYNADYLSPTGSRLIAQAEGAGSVDRVLGPGDYYLALSGAGNRYFTPTLADTGYAGQTGGYGLVLTAADAGLASGDGPAALAADPAPGAVLDASPLAIRVALSGPLDEATIVPDLSVRLIANPTGDFGGPDDAAVPLGPVSFDPLANELVVTPAAPLAPGFSYRLILAGDAATEPAVLAGLDGTQLGATALTPTGTNYSLTFRVAGSEGNTAAGVGANDTVSTARDLGDLPIGQVVQVTGTIGDDPTDMTPFNLSDVDLYHFRLTEAGAYAFAAEAFAGRIGSALDPALALFRLDADGSLVFVTANANTSNDTAGTDSGIPLLTDSAVYAGLTAGDYYLAVSSGFNYPDPAGGSPVGENGVFDPAVPHSGFNGNSTGPYVLNLKVERAADPPRVLAATLTDGTALDGTVSDGPPPRLSVQFSGPVNLTQLAFDSYTRTFETRVSAVTVTGPGGAVYFPRLEGYDAATHTATFLMIDALPPGDYELRLSGALGLTDLAGNPLAGNDPSGDTVVRFGVGGAARGTAGDPLTWTATGAGTDLANPEVIGRLFPTELVTGVAIVRTGADPAAPGPASSYFQIELSQEQDYTVTLADGTGQPTDAVATVWLNGVEQAVLGQGGGSVFLHLAPGTYVIGVDWPDGGGSSETYSLTVAMLGSPEPAAPLTAGPAPALRLRLAADPTPPNPPSPPPPPPPPGPTSPPPGPPTGHGPSATPTGPATPGQTLPTPSSGGKPVPFAEVVSLPVGTGATAPSGGSLTDHGVARDGLGRMTVSTGTTVTPSADAGRPTPGVFALLGDRTVGRPGGDDGEAVAAAPALRLGVTQADPGLIASLLVLSAPALYGADGTSAKVGVASNASDLPAATPPVAPEPSQAGESASEVGRLGSAPETISEPAVAHDAARPTAGVPPVAVAATEAVGTPAAPAAVVAAADSAESEGQTLAGRVGWVGAAVLSLVFGCVQGRRRWWVGRSPRPVPTRPVEPKV